MLPIPPLPSQSKLDQTNFITVPKLVKRQDLTKEFYKIFKFERNERLVRVFRCAIAKPTLMEGKMYLSEHYISFKLNWPGQTAIIIPFDEIIDIRKSSFANIVPNAIEIETTFQTLFFGSLTGRGEKFIDMNLLWEQHVDPYSLFRKFPDLSKTPCVCKSGDNLCAVCLKNIEMEKSDPQGKRRSSTCCGYFKSLDRALSKSGKLSTVAESQSTPSINEEDEELSEIISPPESPKRHDFDDTLPTPITTTQSSTTLTTEECKCSQDPSSQLLISNMKLPFPLKVLWKEWFDTTTGGNSFCKFLVDHEKITNLQVSSWNDTEIVAFEDIQCTGIEFENVKVGMTKHTSRIIPLKHGIPFVPKTSLALNTFTINSVGSDHLCVQNDAVISLMGICTNLKICLKQDGNETRLDLYLNLEMTGKAKFNIPKALAEKVRKYLYKGNG
jgi:GRAM domain